ncbi:MAG: hypothetical protein ACRDRW_17135 [Pseudonocardiaceae bacterium]
MGEDRSVPSGDTGDHTFHERVLAVHGLGARAAAALFTQLPLGRRRGP